MDANPTEMREVAGEEQRDIAGGAATSCPRFSWGSCTFEFPVTGPGDGPVLTHETTHAR